VDPGKLGEAIDQAQESLPGLLDSLHLRALAGVERSSRLLQEDLAEALNPVQGRSERVAEPSNEPGSGQALLTGLFTGLARRDSAGGRTLVHSLADSVQSK
jgi:hypothetical protein